MSAEREAQLAVAVHQWSNAIATCLNEMDLQGPKEDSDEIVALMIVVAAKDREVNPAGVSLNWDREHGVWKVDEAQGIEQAEPA